MVSKFSQTSAAMAALFQLPGAFYMLVRPEDLITDGMVDPKSLLDKCLGMGFLKNKDEVDRFVASEVTAEQTVLIVQVNGLDSVQIGDLKSVRLQGADVIEHDVECSYYTVSFFGLDREVKISESDGFKGTFFGERSEGSGVHFSRSTDIPNSYYEFHCAVKEFLEINAAGIAEKMKPLN